MRTLLCLLFICYCSTVYSQGEANSLKGTPFQERIVTGGGFGLSFGNTQDFVSVSPLIGYRLTAKLIAGTTITYRYTNYKYFRPAIKLNDYGVNPFLQFFVYKNIFLQTEVEYLNYEFPKSTTETFRRNFNSFLAGGGFRQSVGDKFGFYAMALYNFSYTPSNSLEYTPYDSPIIFRAGISFGNFGF